MQSPESSSVDHPSKVIDLKLANPALNKAFSVVKNPVEKFFGVDALNQIVLDIRGIIHRSNFFDAALERLDIEYCLSEEDLCKIPTDRPLVVVANHPFGGIEGVVLGSLFNRVGAKTKLLGNYLLNHIPELRDSLITVDPFSNRNAANIAGLKQCMRWLRESGTLITFPSGEVSHLNLGMRQVRDPAWSTHIAALVRRTGADVLPVFIDGRNSSLFQVLGLLHPRLRTALLAHELFNKRGSKIHLKVGKPIPAKKLMAKGDDQQVTDYLRMKTYILKNRKKEKGGASFLSFPIRRTPRFKPVIDAVDRGQLEAEIAALPASQRLVDHGEWLVCDAHAAQVPELMREIGRLREVTFREVGEGTGKELDLDRFDEWYTHLFLWNREARELVGAYRIGHMDILTKRAGIRALYTHTLFHFKPGFLEHLGQALEMGRSFIRSEYQRKFGCLTLLWQGIGAYVAKHPEYTRLFGPVSISREYQSVSKNLIVQFLKENKSHPELARLVKPRKPHRRKSIQGFARKELHRNLQCLDDVSALVAEVEMDGKGIPVLLRHYLKLDAQLISFNVDKDFSDVLDGLVVVDLLKTDARLVKRYMGEAAYKRYLEYHR